MSANFGVFEKMFFPFSAFSPFGNFSRIFEASENNDNLNHEEFHHQKESKNQRKNEDDSQYFSGQYQKDFKIRDL